MNELCFEIGAWGDMTPHTLKLSILTAAAAAQSSTSVKVGDRTTQLYANDEAILSIVQTRKDSERCKLGGLVKFASGSIHRRN